MGWRCALTSHSARAARAAWARAAWAMVAWAMDAVVARAVWARAFVASSAASRASPCLGRRWRGHRNLGHLGRRNSARAGPVSRCVRAAGHRGAAAGGGAPLATSRGTGPPGLAAVAEVACAACQPAKASPAGPSPRVGSCGTPRAGRQPGAAPPPLPPPPRFSRDFCSDPGLVGPVEDLPLDQLHR